LALSNYYRCSCLTYLFGDQLIWVMFAFAVAIWFSGRIIWGVGPNWLSVLVGAFLLTAFMTDFALLLAQDAVIGAGILALIVLVSRWLYKETLWGSAFLVVLSWVIGTIIINAVQGSLNIFNPWV